MSWRRRPKSRCVCIIIHVGDELFCTRTVRGSACCRLYPASSLPLALSTHNGNNINFGEVGGHQPEPTTSSRNHWSPVDPNRLPTDVPQCSLGTLHSNSIPRGQTHVDSIRSIGSHFTIQQCAQRCCQLGSTMCQYAWMFEYRCFAVACPDNPEQCTPTRFPDVDTTFIEISWPGGQLIVWL